MLSSYNLKNKQTIQISGLILQYCSATTLYRRLDIMLLYDIYFLSLLYVSTVKSFGAEKHLL